MNDPERNPVEELAEEYLERYRRGEKPTVTEYTERHPEWAEEIEDLFPAMMLMEQCKPRDDARTPTWEGGEVGEGPRIERLGDYRIVREIGRGGMGIVYEAVQESLLRRVALKILPAGMLLSPRKLERFKRESMAAANLHHTNIVGVFGVGEQDGLHYYVMQYIEGRGLDEIAAGATDPRDHRALADMALQAARALQYAHEKGTLHRDIKPANLLLDGQGTVWITDFGLAKVLAGQEDLTDTGDLLGTIRYMPPERFDGRSDERGDIYGLGLTLYEVLTGRAAFHEGEPLAVMKKVREEGPPPPRKLDPRIPRDLETVVLKAIARDPEDRYPTAGELAEDLRRFLEDRPVRARRAGRIERLWRWCRRNRMTAALAATAAASLLLAAAAGWLGYLMTTNALDRESLRRDEAEVATRRAEANVELSLEAFEEIFDNLAGPDGPRPTPRRGGPGMEPEEEDAALLQSILSFYDRFAESNATNPRLRLEAARAHRRVGTIRERLGEVDEAEVAYARAVGNLERLVGEYPSDLVYRHELALTLPLSAARASDPAALEEAEERCRRAIGIAEDLVASHPGALPYVEGLVNAICLRCMILTRLERTEEALRCLEEISRIRAGLPGREGGLRPFRTVELVKAKESLGVLLIRQERHAEARSVLEAAIEDARRAPGRRRRDPSRLPRLYERLAEALRALGEDRQAEQALRKGGEARRRPRPGPPSANPRRLPRGR